MRITCLHTAESNIAVFDTAAEGLGTGPGVLQHKVRSDLWVAVERAGHLTVDIAEATALELLALARNSDVVVLTCSTLGPAIENSAANAEAPILRADEALASAVVHIGGKVVVLCAVQTTIGPTSGLFFRAAQQLAARVEVQLVPGAWALFKDVDQRRGRGAACA